MVRFVILPYRPLAKMTHQSVPGHFKLRQAQAGPFDFETFQHRRFDVRYEIGLPNIDQAADVTLLADLEVIVLAEEAIREAVRTVEDEIFITVDVEGEGRVGHS